MVWDLWDSMPVIVGYEEWIENDQPLLPRKWNKDCNGLGTGMSILMLILTIIFSMKMMVRATIMINQTAMKAVGIVKALIIHEKYNKVAIFVCVQSLSSDW